MRILFCYPSYKPAYRAGGPVQSISGMAESLVRRGHEVIVCTTNSNFDEDLEVPVDVEVRVDGVKVWYFRRDEFMRRWFWFSPYLMGNSGYAYAPKMQTTLEKFGPHFALVHTHIPFVYPTLAGFRFAKRYRIPLFYSQRGVFDPKSLRYRYLKKYALIKFVENRILSAATTLIALTEEEEANYRALNVTTPCRIVPNGVDVDSFRGRAGADLTEHYSLSPDSLVILFLGRISPRKGVGRLLDAFIAVAKAVPHAVLVLAGPGEFNQMENYRSRAQAAGLSDRVIFPGVVENERKVGLLARADLFCLPSDSEGLSVAVLEALASETAVLLSPECNFPVVETADVGRVVANDAEKIASALIDLLSSPGHLRTMGVRAREFARREYDWEVIVDRLLDVYSEGIDRHKAGLCKS